MKKNLEDLYKLYLDHVKLMKTRGELYRRLSKKLNERKDIENMLDKYADLQMQLNFSRRSLVRIAMTKGVSKQTFNNMLDEFGNRAMGELL